MAAPSTKTPTRRQSRRTGHARLRQLHSPGSCIQMDTSREQLCSQGAAALFPTVRGGAFVNAPGDETWELQSGHRNSGWLELRQELLWWDGAGQARPVWGHRGQILTLTWPFLPWGHAEPVGKGMAVVQGQHRAVGLAVLQCGDGNSWLPQPALAPQLWHQAELPPYCHPTAAAPLES